MKKKRTGTWSPLKKSREKILMVMRLTLLLMCGFVFSLSASVRAQDQMVTLSVERMSFTGVIAELKRQTQLEFFYSFDEVNAKRTVSLSVKNEKIDDVLRKLLGDGFEWEYNGNMVIIKPAAPQEQVKKSIRLKGFVRDVKKQPIPGVTVMVEGLTIGTVTDARGWFAMNLPMVTGTLEFSFIGFKKKSVDFTEKIARDTLRITMEEDNQTLDEAVVVAFGTQKKESVVSAITTVRPMDLKSSSSDLTTSFAGKIAGIVGWQTGGLPGALTEEEMNTQLYIRGVTSFQSGANRDPLILLDGVESSKLDLARIAPEDIESFSVMKDASATAMYGARGANGVILVTTKKGEEGSVYTSVRYEAIASMPTKQIDVVSPVDYMKLYNEALRGRDPLAKPEYSVLDIQRRQSGNYPSWVYPANDWYKILFKDHNINHHLGINIRGGSKVMQYYASVNYNRDMGMLKTDQLNQFDVNIKNSTLGFRANLNVNLHPTIRLLYNTSTTWDKYHGPLTSVAQAYELAFSADPVRFAPTYPADLTYNWDHVRFGNYGTGGVTNNPYEAIHRGYLDRNRYSTINKLEYIHNLAALLKGLEVRGSVSLSSAGYYSIPYSTIPFEYELASYDEAHNVHTLRALNADKAKRTIELDKQIGKQHVTETQLTYELRALHTAAWKEHQTSLTAVLSALESTSSAPEDFLESVERRNLGFSMRGTYGYKDRYFAEASFGYNGSERFARKNKMGFFPAGGLAWVTSAEPFMAGTENWLPFLKFRFSWGKVGNDGIIDRPRFVHLENLTHYGSNGFVSVRPGENTAAGYAINTYANEDIQWEIAEQYNLGMEAKLFKGILEFTLDVYQQMRHNILDYRRVVPANMGIQEFQLANIGKARSRGIDFSGKIQHAFSPDFWVILNGTFTYTKAVVKELEEAADKPEWQSRIGHELSQPIGYIDQGLFRDEAEIANAAYQDGQLMPGDIRYRDINNDGKIDINDIYMDNTLPKVYYGFGNTFAYKKFDLDIYMYGQLGVKKFNSTHSSNCSAANLASGILAANPTDYAYSIWNSQTNPNGEVPGIAYKSVTLPENAPINAFWEKASFLRVRNITLGYNWDARKLAFLKGNVQNIRLFVDFQNPFTLTKFEGDDPEIETSAGNLGHGQYPQLRVYSFGAKISF